MDKIGKIYDISKLRNRSTPLYVVITGKDVISDTYIAKDLASERSFGESSPTRAKIQINHFEIASAVLDTDEAPGRTIEEVVIEIDGKVPERTIEEVVAEIENRAVLAAKVRQIYIDAQERSKNITTSEPPYHSRDHYRLEFLSLRNRLLECHRQLKFHESWFNYVENSAKYKTDDKYYIDAVHRLKKAVKALKRAKKRVFFFVDNERNAQLLLSYIDQYGNDLYSVLNPIPDNSSKIELILKNYDFVKQKLSLAEEK